MNERKKERKKEREKERKKERKKERMHKWMNEWKKKETQLQFLDLLTKRDQNESKKEKNKRMWVRGREGERERAGKEK
jgi:hypothetical protein